MNCYVSEIKILARYREFAVKWNSEIAVLDIKMVVKYCYVLNVFERCCASSSLSRPHTRLWYQKQRTTRASHARISVFLRTLLLISSSSVVHNHSYTIQFRFTLFYLPIRINRFRGFSPRFSNVGGAFASNSIII